MLGASVWYVINAERKRIPLTKHAKGRLGTIKEGEILFLSECDLDVETWMKVDLSLHQVAEQTGAQSGALWLCENRLRKLLYVP